MLAPKGLDSKKQYADPVRRNECDNDPHTYKGHMCLATGNSLLQMTMGLSARLKEVRLPLLIIHGEQDELVTPEGFHQP